VTTGDGGCILLGESWTGPGTSLWLLKLNATGGVEWEKTYGGGSSINRAAAIETTGDGGYLLAASTEAFGINGVWLLKLAGDGSITWQKGYQGTGVWPLAVQSLPDGYLVATGSGDAGVMKVGSDGAVLWFRNYGEPLPGNESAGYKDVAAALTITHDGGYLLAGSTSSFGITTDRFWLFRVDSQGRLGCGIDWEKQVTVQSTDAVAVPTTVTVGTPAVLTVTTPTLTIKDVPSSLSTQCGGAPG
jgi:predicted secreted protein